VDSDWNFITQPYVPQWLKCTAYLVVSVVVKFESPAGNEDPPTADASFLPAASHVLVLKPNSSTARRLPTKVSPVGQHRVRASAYARIKSVWLTTPAYGKLGSCRAALTTMVTNRSTTLVSMD
jgi:hypothetical protein